MKTQQQQVLDLLKMAGPLGVNSYDLTYKHSIKQAPTRVRELRLAGYQIKSRTQSNKSVTYVLLNSQPSMGSTEAPIQPQRELQAWEKDYESYIGQDGRTYWREV